MRQKLARAAGYIIVLLGSLGMVLYLARDPVRDGLGHLAATWVSRTLPGTITVGALRGSLLSALVLRDVYVRDEQDQTIVRIAEVRLHYDLLALVSGRLYIRTIDIVQPHVNLVQGLDGLWNLDTLVSTLSAESPLAGPGFSLALDIPHVRIHHGTLTLHTPTLPGVQQVHDIDLDMRLQADAQGAQIHVEHATAEVQPAAVRLHTLQGSLSRGADGTLRLEAFRVQTAHTLITGAGVLPGGSQAASLSIGLQPLQTAELGRLLQRDDLHGLLTLALTAQGPPQALEVHAQLQAAQGQIAVEGGLDTQATPWRYHGQMAVRHADLAALLHRDELRSDINVQMHVAGEGLTLPTFRGRLQFEAQPSHLGDLTLSPSQVILMAEAGRFQVQRCDLQTSVARLSVTGSVDLAGHSALQYDLTARLASLRQLLGSATLDGTLQAHGTVHGARAALRTQGVAELQHFRYDDMAFTTLQLTYEGTELGTQPQVTAQLIARQGHAVGLSFESLTIESFYDHNAPQLQITAAVRQSARATGKAQGTWLWSGIQPKLVLQDVLLQLAERTWRLEAPAELLYDAPGLRLAGLALTHADERFELAGTWGGPQPQNVHLKLSQLDLTFLHRLLSLSESVRGRTSLQAHLAGTAEAPQLNAEVTWHPEASRHIPFDKLQILIGYAQRQLRGTIRLRQANEDLLVLETRLPVDLTLRPLPLAQRLLLAPVAVQLQVQQLDLNLLSRWQPTWPGLSGALAAELAVQGTYAALELEAAVRLRQGGLHGVLQQLDAPLHLQATFGLPGVFAGSTPSTKASLGLPQLRQAVLRLPKLRAQIVGQDQRTHTLQVQHLVAQISGQWSAGRVEGVLKALQAQVRLAEFPLAKVALAGRLNSQEVELTRLHVRLPHSEMRGSGKLTWPQQLLQVRLDVPRLRLDDIGVLLPSPLPPLVQGVIEVRGSVAAPHIETRLQYAGGQLSATLAGDFHTRPLRYSAQLRLDDLDVASLLPGAQGTLRLTLHAQGVGFTGPQRRADFDVHLDTSHLNLAPNLTAHLKGRVFGATLHLEDFRLQSTPAVVVASGTWSTTLGNKTALTYEIKLKDLQPLQDYFGTPLQARGHLRGTLQGTWPTLQAHSRLRLREWTYAKFHGQRVQADLLLAQFPRAPQATVKAQFINLKGPTLPASTVHLQGTYTAPQGTMQLQVSAGPYRQTVVEGRWTLAAEQRFTVSRFHLQHHGATWDNVTPIVVVRSSDGRLDVPQCLLQSGRQEFRAQGILTGEGVIAAQVQLRQVQLSPQIELLLPQMAPLEGQLDLRLGVEGTFVQPQVEGTLTVTALHWKQHEIGAVSGKFSTVGQALQLKLHWQDAARQFLEAEGTVEFAVPHALALRIRASEVDVRLAQVLSPAVIQSSGRLNLDIHLTGTVQQPALNGIVALRDGTLQLAATGIRYTGLQAQIALRGTRVDIVQLHAESGQGVLDITGWATSSGRQFTHLDCTLQAKEFTILHTPELEAMLSATVTVRGSLDDLNATGTITLPHARAQLGGKLMGLPEVVRPEQLRVENVYGAGPPQTLPQKSTAIPRQSKLLHFLRADVRLELPQNVWVTGPGTAIELRGALRLTKARASKLVLVGSVETIQGFANFYSGKFTIERGRVDFTGSPEIDPLLDVVATREAHGYVVSINVAGRAKTPQLHLSSTPELQQADIVTLLVFGKTTDRLTASERRDFSSQAQQIVENVATGELEQLLAKPLGFDAVDIQTGENLGSSKVSVGRYVTQNLFLSYEQQLGEESGNKVGVEYSVNRHLKLKGSSTNKGAAAFDLLWRIDY